MKVLVLGATGATGSWAVKELLKHGKSVITIVRCKERLIEKVGEDPNLSVIEGTALDMEENHLRDLLKDCDAVISCLGHNLTFKGIFGRPRKLVRDSLKKITQCINHNEYENPVKVILMNTSGNRNRDLEEKRTFGEILVIGLIRLLVPPQSDNEQAADFLREDVGRTNKKIEWVVVRPDGLIDHEEISTYEVYPSPVRSPIFNAGQTSRINVGFFMSELLSDEILWEKWIFSMPVIYNT